MKEFGTRGGRSHRWQAILILSVWLAALGGESPAQLVTTNDPFCSLTNVVSAQLLRPQPESTRRMTNRLGQIRKAIDPRTMIYFSDQRVELLKKSLERTTNVHRQVAIRFQLGVDLLQSGLSDDALREFEKAEAVAGSLGMPIDPSDVIELRYRKAIALLRIGEQESCLLNHNAESCVFPIGPAAFHKMTRGSQGAVRLLTEQLEEYPDDLSARWLLNIAHMTLGNYPDKVLAKWLIPPKSFASEHEIPRFPDIAGALGVDVNDLAGGCILDDFNNDGYIDIVASSWGLSGQIRIFFNDQNGRFIERTQEAGLIGLVSGLNVQQTDYNNDGWLDIWVPRGAWLGSNGRIPNSLLRNNGDGTFTDVTEEAGLLSFHPTQASVWFDYDGDGWLDLFIGNETTDPKQPEPCELYRNNRNGTFTECAAKAGVAVTRFVKGVTSADYDHDGRPDLYLSCRDGTNILFHNDGPSGTGAVSLEQWSFSNVTAHAGVPGPMASFPSWFFDYDNDGWEDLFVSGYSIRNVGDIAADYLGLPHQAARAKMYRNEGNGRFTDVTEAVRMNRACHTMGCNFGDLDNDGWLDFYLGTGDPDFATLIPNRMFRNAGGKFFQEVTTAGGFGQLQKGHGVGFADLDNDGAQDIYAVTGGAVPGDAYRNSLFLNPGNTNHWLKLKLVGKQSNRAAIGARIKVSVSTPAGLRHIYKTVNSGGSFGSSPLRQEFGLADATAIQSVEIIWPASGIVQKLDGLQLDQCYEIQEGNNQPAIVNLKRIHFPSGAQPHHHAMRSGL